MSFLSLWCRKTRHFFKKSFYLKRLNENRGTFLIVQTWDGTFYGKVERVDQEVILMSIGDRVLQLSIGDIMDVKLNEKHPLRW